MAKLRVYHLARELNLDNSEVIRELQHMGVPVTSHSNTVEDRLAEQLRKRLGPAAAEAAKNATKVSAEEKEEVIEAAAEIHEPPVIEPPQIEAPPEPKTEIKPEPKREAEPEPKVEAKP